MDYVINYDYISQELCENKAVPEMACNGKCHLKKELAKTVEGDKETSNGKRQFFSQEIEVLFFQKFHFSFLFVVRDKQVKKILSYVNFYQSKFDFSIFHPPCLL